jgi:DNA helicase HerA-like ATPase
VLRHAAVVGSTGAGKTSAVASLLQGFVRGGWTDSNIVVIDPHGEYARALADDAAVRSVLADGDNLLHVPFWALSAADIFRVFAGATGGPTTTKRFAELVRQRRQEFAAAAPWLQLDPAAVTADTPVPFDIRRVWFAMDYENNETRDTKTDESTVRIEAHGDAQTLNPTRFTPYGAGGAIPNQGPMYSMHGTVPELLRLGLQDPRLQFLLERPGDEATDHDPLVLAMQEWLGQDQPVSVLDFSGVPDEAAELAIGVVMDLLFEVAVRTPHDGDGIGRPGPVLIVLEEAHRYLGDSATPMARDAANRIAREGRKYGVGLLLVTQRPAELPDTALAQCGTLIALRLTNSNDQGKIRAALPDSVAGLAAALPALRTGEAVISGEGLILPARTLIDCPDPLPRAEDPSLAPWRSEPSLPDLAQALAAWRGTYETPDG